ncbi:MAG: glucose-6-phosphate isomerase [Alphaproteobacteria bacterium]|nr:glucose-6-phosphate isomerase [Alphaproteobacteria bacterium]
METAQDITASLGVNTKVTLSAENLAAMMQRTEASLKTLRQKQQSNALPLLNLAERTDDLAAITELADHIRGRFGHVLVLGTGGSSLGGKTLLSLASSSSPAIRFEDNVDPHTFDSLIERLPLEKTAIIAISKSGGTVETLSQLAVCMDALRKKAGEAALKENLFFITESKLNPLTQLAERFGCRTLPMDPGIGGRFSVLTAVGLLPAAIAGLDIAAFRAGAGRAVAANLKAGAPKDAPAALGAALSIALAEAGYDLPVVMPYVERLALFSQWYRQLWAESLGKNGKGTTPTSSLGTVDQHSQLQLYIDGPKDKFVTLFFLDTKGQGAVIPADLMNMEGLGYIQGRTLGDVLHAEQWATAQSLQNHGVPVRIFHLPAMKEAVLGELLMHFMLETIIAADLLGVDAFDQPAVEEGKILARKSLETYAPVHKAA